MAVAQKMDSRMRLILDDGVDDVSGKQLHKTKGFNNVKTDATTDQLYTIANAVTPLQQRPLMNVERNDSFDITQE
ncbi:hypothetical protein GCM10008983_14860 [Lentibacillus halophilus]|uniref:DUF1659 domain-containing protein n=1 Tax=Lentibacillus halophilus TaxID=295065 RepID=A0ABN0Z978_9BACI